LLQKEVKNGNQYQIAVSEDRGGGILQRIAIFKAAGMEQQCPARFSFWFIERVLRDTPNRACFSDPCLMS
jgi:hypothetical protein